MLLYGASGHAKVIIDCLKSSYVSISGVFDDDPVKSTILEYPVLGKYYNEFMPEENIIISIGDNLIRRRISNIVSHSFGTVFHKSAVISNTARIDCGTVIFHNSVIQSSAIIGKHVIINTASSVDHECIIDDYVHVSPNATLCGNVSVGTGTHIGAASVIVPNVNIGKWVTIGAGTVIISDIPDYAVVVGNPGRIIKYKDKNKYELKNLAVVAPYGV